MLHVEVPRRRALTSMQAGMVLGSMRDPRSGVYVVQDVCETAEALDIELLQRAWRAVAARRDALRTVVEISPDHAPAQYVTQDAGIPWHAMDWSGAPAADLQSRLADFLRADSERGFDFAQSVPMRITLLRMPGGSSILVWTSHHSLLDGRSYLIVWQEWFAAYDALARGDGIHSSAAPSFASYLDWLDRQDLTAAEPFWRQHLAGVSRTTGFIADRLLLRGAADAERMARESAVLSEDLTVRLHEFGVRHGFTAGTLMQCAWALLLSRYSASSDVVFGITHAGRRSPVPGAANIVGPMINTLPARIRVPPDDCVLPWIQAVRRQSIAMRDHEHTPLGKIREWRILPPGGPPFDSLFVYDRERPGDALRKLGGNWSYRHVTRRQRTDSPLTLAAYGAPRVSFDLVYDTRFFCRETIAGMAGHLQTLLEEFPAQPHARLAELNMLTGGERRWLIEERNHTAAPRPPDLCAHQLFERRAAQNPAAVAIESAGERVSYSGLNRSANQLAWLLKGRGAGPEDLVAVCLPRSSEAVIAVLAVLKAGAAFVLLPPDVPPGRLTSMLADACPKLAIAAAACAGKLADGGCPVLLLDRLDEDLARQPASEPPCAVKPENAAYAAFTSGSTGKPKAAVLTHRALANHTVGVARALDISSADRRLQFAAIGSDMFISEVFTYLCSGATLVFCLDHAGNSIAEFVRLLGTHRITIAGLPSSWWSAWTAAMSAGHLPVPSSLRAVIAGMERLSPAALSAWNHATGGTVRLFNAYGPSETGPIATIYEAGSSRWEGDSPAPIGRPIANIRVYVLDEHGNPAPVGIPGELYIGGDGVGRGYLNAPELTAAKFPPDPFAGSGQRLFRTGDVVFTLPDGHLVFLGRVDRQVKIRGFRVELEEVEAVLAEHPAVLRCAVVLQDDDDQRLRLVAYLSARTSPGPVPDDLRLHLSRRLPDYMLPAAFVTLDAMPMTANGKIDRRSLPRRVTPIETPPGCGGQATSTERRLAAIWHEVLGSAPASLAANFFESGGDSLRATQFVLRIQREFERELPFAQFLRAPTIAQIARALGGGMAAAPPSAMLAYAHQGTRVPLFCITSQAHDLYVFRHLMPHLDGSQPVFVLNVPLHEGEGVCRVEELAARLSQSIRAIRPEGPYILAGYCFGGILAFEAARQLIAAGEEVPLVAFFDTPAPGYPRIFGSRRMAARVQALGQPVRMEPASAEVTAARTYVPKSIRADIAQFIARDQAVSTRVLEDPRLAWRSLCKGRFRLYRVPGDHVTWLQEPNVQTAARCLTEALGRQAAATATR